MNILLTGASRGIGASTYDLLRKTGHDVVGHSTRGGDLITGDLMDPAAPRQVWDVALDRLGGRVDVLVNNAGIFEGIAEDAPDEEWHSAWHRTMQINLQASADFCRLAVNHFRERGTSGRIVNVSSRAAHRGDSPHHWHYAASKAGMAAMTKTIARAYAAERIYCFAVCPGWTVTEMAADHVDASVVADIPLGHPATTGEVAETIRWLAIDAPASATGALIDVNGASYVR